MAKIDIENWKAFKVGDLFDIHPTKAYGMTNAQLMDDGENPVVVNSSFNNGIGGYTTQPITEQGGIITFSDTTTADALFYQPSDFVGYPHVQGMYPIGEYAEKWTKLRCMFFVTAFKRAAVLHEFDYAYKFTREIAAQLEVTLPVDASGEPDWVYMDSYISQVMSDAEASLDALGQADSGVTAVDVNEWQEFVIGDLFEITRPVSRSMMKYEDGDVPFVASGNFNNGVAGYCRPRDDEELDAGMCITVSPLDGSSFFQKEPFLGRGGAGSAILMLRNNNFSEMNGLFIASVIRNTLTKYSYADQLNSKKIANEVIMLPVDSGGDPDWDYMDVYVSRLVKEMHARVDNLI